MCVSEQDRCIISENLLYKLVSLIINPPLKLFLREVWSAAPFLIHFRETTGVNNLRLYFTPSRITSVIILYAMGCEICLLLRITGEFVQGHREPSLRSNY